MIDLCNSYFGKFFIIWEINFWTERVYRKSNILSPAALRHIKRLISLLCIFQCRWGCVAFRSDSALVGLLGLIADELFRSFRQVFCFFGDPVLKHPYRPPRPQCYLLYFCIDCSWLAHQIGGRRRGSKVLAEIIFSAQNPWVSSSSNFTFNYLQMH